jgi:uncharacterized protein with von Willebrand factor type A (vWA) domain
VSLGQQPQLDDLQRQLAAQLGDDGIPNDGRYVASAKEKIRELLKERAALLVLDDVWTRDAAEAFNVVGTRGRLLLTTRGRRPGHRSCRAGEPLSGAVAER